MCRKKKLPKKNKSATLVFGILFAPTVLATTLNALVLCTILMCLMYSLGTSDPEIQPSKLICCEKKGPKICQHHYHKQDLLKIPPENDAKLSSLRK